MALLTLLTRHRIELGELGLPLLALTLSLALTLRLGLRLALSLAPALLAGLSLLTALRLALLATAYDHPGSLPGALLAALAHGRQLREFGAVAVGIGSIGIIAHAVAAILLAAVAFAFLAAVDHDAIAAHTTVAAHAGWNVAGVVSVEDNVDCAAAQIGLFHHEGIT